MRFRFHEACHAGHMRRLLRADGKSPVALTWAVASCTVVLTPLTLLTCRTTAPTPSPSVTTTSTSSPLASTTPTRAVAAAAPCAQARTITTAFPGPNDVKLGSLSFGGLADQSALIDGGPNWMPYNAYFFKSGAQLPPGATATMSISDDAAAYASIATENGSDGGALKVSYTSCPAQPGATGF